MHESTVCVIHVHKFVISILHSFEFKQLQLVSHACAYVYKHNVEPCFNLMITKLQCCIVITLK